MQLFSVFYGLNGTIFPPSHPKLLSHSPYCPSTHHIAPPLPMFPLHSPCFPLQILPRSNQPPTNIPGHHCLGTKTKQPPSAETQIIKDVHQTPACLLSFE